MGLLDDTGDDHLRNIRALARQGDGEIAASEWNDLMAKAGKWSDPPDAYPHGKLRITVNGNQVVTLPPDDSTKFIRLSVRTTGDAGESTWSFNPDPGSVPMYEDAAARAEATAAERARIRAELAKLAPTETQYTRLEWRWEEKGAQRMFDKVMRLFDEPTKG